MAESQTNIIDAIRQDIVNARTIVDSGLDLNDTIINGIWRHFSDVEIYVPLASMDLRPEERVNLAQGILQEMDEAMGKIREGYAKAASEEELESIHKGPLGQKVDSLFKELAGCYAEIINQEIPQLPENMKQVVAESLVAELAQRFDTTEDEIVNQVRHDSSLRMLFRRTGLNPDDLL